MSLSSLDEHFVNTCQTNFVRWVSRQEVNIKRTITVNNAVRRIFAAYSSDIRTKAAFP